MSHRALLVATLATFALPAQAAPMQAVYRVTLDSVNDALGLFDTAVVGDQGIVTFLFDPDIAVGEWRSTFDDSDAMAGGTKQETVPGVHVPSPITSAALTIRGKTVAITPKYNAMAFLTSNKDGPANYEIVVIFAAGNFSPAQDLTVDNSFATQDPSLLGVPSLDGSYDFALPYRYGTTFGTFTYSEDGITKTDIEFTAFHFTMGPVDTAPTLTPVPLPAAAPLTLAGLGALAMLRRRRQAPRPDAGA